MNLFLIRHGQSWNNARPETERVEDPPLTDIGHQQCSHLADHIHNLELTHLVSSPFLRTLQTADYLAKATNMATEVRVPLHEQGGCMKGPFPNEYEGRPGMNRAEILAQFPTFEVSSKINGDGWWANQPFETERLARQRAAMLLADATERYADSGCRVAYVMHADIMRLVLECIPYEPFETASNTAVTHVRLGRSECTVLSYNSVDHLPADLVTH